MAKGRLLGVQFDTLFTDNLYSEISAHAVRMAMKIKEIFAEKGIPFYIDSPTNQQFIILPQKAMDALAGKVAYEIWERLSDGRVKVPEGLELSKIDANANFARPGMNMNFNRGGGNGNGGGKKQWVNYKKNGKKK